MSTKTILFGERAAGVYLKTEIYDPDIDGSNISSSGKIVPAVGSQIVDNTVGLHNQLYTVVAVDQDTYKAILEPSTYVVDSTAQVDRVLSYGNDIFMLYFSPSTITVGSTRINVTRLIVDNKLSLFGNHAATYQLVTTDEDGKEHIISRWYNASGAACGTAIPMQETGVEGIRKCDGCYTDAELHEGDVVSCRIYSAAGIMIAKIELIAKAAHFLNESISSANPIIGLKVTANQMFNDGVLYLFQNQNVDELAIFTELHYSNGTIREFGIDKLRSFVYGLENIRTDIVGVEYTLTVKYYLSSNDVTDENAYVYQLTTDTTFQEDVVYYTRTMFGGTWQYVAASVVVGNAVTADTYYTRTSVSYGSVVESDTKNQFIAKQVTVRIVDATQDVISKISPIPVWSTSTGSWNLKFATYRSNRRPYNKPLSEITTTGYVGNVFNTQQVVTLHTSQIVNGIPTVYEQQFCIELRDRNNPNPQADPNIGWLIADEAGSSFVYGDNNAPHIRPRIYYNGRDYRIPGELFTGNSTQSAVEVFLENFYYRATPPKTTDESIAPAPTHFLVKDATGRSLMTTRRNITIKVGDDVVANFSGELDLADGVDGAYVGSTLLVEFSRDINGVTEILYGVPVDVVNN